MTDPLLTHTDIDPAALAAVTMERDMLKQQRDELLKLCRDAMRLAYMDELDYADERDLGAIEDRLRSPVYANA